MSPFAVAMFAVLATMLLALVRAFRGPSVFDRVLAANMFGTKTVLLIAVAGFLAGRPEWLDLAILYALMNFTGMIALSSRARRRVSTQVPRMHQSDTGVIRHRPAPTYTTPRPVGPRRGSVPPPTRRSGGS